MKWLCVVIILVSSCQSFQTSPKKEEHSKRSESMMHGWKFEKTTGPKTTESTGNPSNGKKLYQMNCQKCHGNSGKGDGGVSRIMDTRLADLTKSDYQHKRHFFYVISEGSVHGMPAWKSVLSSGQIADIIAYIKTLE